MPRAYKYRNAQCIAPSSRPLAQPPMNSIHHLRTANVRLTYTMHTPEDGRGPRSAHAAGIDEARSFFFQEWPRHRLIQAADINEVDRLECIDEFLVDLGLYRYGP